jgi:uncharacterized membrane protein SpoIIM required for sporulation
MDLARFVRLRRPLWDDFEAGLERLRRRPRNLGYRDLEELALRYRQVLHDHALAASRYPGTGVAGRLARLALEGTYRLSVPPAERRRGLVAFFGDRFPRAFRAHLAPLGVVAALFAGAALLGLCLAAVRPGMAVAFLGPKTVADLRQGHLWTESLVTTTPPATSTSGIATNNLSVALVAWAGGAAAGLLGFYIVLLNGFNLGAIVGITLHYSLAGELLKFVSAHGPLELTLVLVSAAAGLGIGRAVVSADDRPRSVALAGAARESLTLMLGCLPWFVLLALVEVLISPQPAVPATTKVILGLALEALFLLVAFGAAGPAGARHLPAGEAAPGGAAG